MKTIPNAETDKVPKVGMRKFLQNLQPSCGGKENLVGVGRTAQDMSTDVKPVKSEQQDITAKDKKEKSSLAKVNPSLYKKLIIDDLTSIAGPSEKYWEVIADRRRKALEEVLEENRRLNALVIALEEENLSCKILLENATDLVNMLKEVLRESQSPNPDNVQFDNQGDSGVYSPDSNSSDKHIHKKMKLSNTDECSDSD